MKISARDRLVGALTRLNNSRSASQRSGRVVLAVALTLITSVIARAQPASGDHSVYGDLSVDERQATGLKPLTFDVILYTESGVLISRQTVSSNGRYRFNNLVPGGYQLAIEVEATEIARISVDLRSPLLKDVRKDIALEWRAPSNSSKGAILSAADNYVRSAEHEKLFRLALNASAKKQYGTAVELLLQITRSDPKDFQAWTELANNHFLQKNLSDAENEYLHALDTHPGFFLALLNLGRLELTQKHYDVAIEVLNKAVRADTNSPDANYFLGEAYLQARKGSVAVQYLNEAVRLDPQGMAEVHLRLARLYDKAGMKDKAAREYQDFLKVRPNHPDRKKLEKYIAENRKQ
jgi:tetratricopeptide (TPR) repeat protein